MRLTGSLALHLRLGVRHLRHDAVFTGFAALLRACALGAGSVVWSLARATLWTQSPFPRPEALVFVFEHDPRLGRTASAVANVRRWMDHARSFEGLAVAASGLASEASAPESVGAAAGGAGGASAGVAGAAGLEVVEGDSAAGAGVWARATVASSSVESTREWRRFTGDTLGESAPQAIPLPACPPHEAGRGPR